MTDAIIELVGVEKGFPGKNVLRGLDLAVAHGETLALFGASGSGKTLCLKHMNRLVEPNAGKVLYRGEDIAAMSSESLQLLRRRVAFVFQGAALFDSMPVVENVGYSLRQHTHQSDDEIRARALQCLRLVGLDEEHLDRMPANLSGGMRTRVALARAIAFEPEVILYDEPMGGLDPRSITRVVQMIVGLQQQLGATSVVATHEVKAAMDMANRVAVLHEGKIAMIGTPDEARRSDHPIVRALVRGIDERARRVE